MDVFVLPLERWAKDLEAERDSGAARDQSPVASDLTQHGESHSILLHCSNTFVWTRLGDWGYALLVVS